jgi:hypothetical protein
MTHNLFFYAVPLETDMQWGDVLCIQSIETLSSFLKRRFTVDSTLPSVLFSQMLQQWKHELMSRI